MHPYNYNYMYIKYKNKDFVGFDDIRHKDLYNRYNNLKKKKDELLKEGFSVNNFNIYKNLFDKYDFYDRINRKILTLINLYRRENLTEQINEINLRYRQKIESIVDNGQNRSQTHIFVRLFWSTSFFKEYFIFGLIIFKRNFLNGIKSRRRTH